MTEDANAAGATRRSGYDDQVQVAALVRSGEHRQIIGGAWDEIGRLQLDYLELQGLSPGHVLLDVGCGCLRGGVHFVDYLEPGHYYGTDLNRSLLDAGYDVELRERGLQSKLPRDHLVCDGSFDFSWAVAKFDFALAQSVFTHLPLPDFRRCLERLWPAMAPGGLFFATLFEVPESHPAGLPFTHPPHGIVTHDGADPYHFHARDVAQLCAGLAWRAGPIAAWGHPRGQRIIRFEALTRERAGGG